MREDAALQVLLVEAFEGADPDGHLLTRDERTRADLDARASGGGDPARTLVARAGILARLLVARVPALRAALRAPRFPVGVAPALILVAGLLGVLSNVLGPERRINILFLPLLAVFWWNLAVYVALAASAGARALGMSLLGHRQEDPAGEERSRGLLTWMAERPWRRAAGATGETAAIVSSGLGAYARAWRRATAPLWGARVRLLLHLGAAALAAGMLLGMYLRGVVFEYRATWESTFLGARELHGLLATILGPAAAVLGRPLPDAEALALIRAPLAGDAALWIHLYAGTTGLFVIAPRTVLALLAARRARRLAADLPVDIGTPYFRRLLAADLGETTRVEAIPYSLRVDAGGAATLTRALHDLAGHHARVRIHAAVEYGADPEELLREAAGPPPDGPAVAERWMVVAFGLAQSPEPEVHGEYIRRLRGWVAQAPAARRLLVMVDASGFRRRLAASGVEAERAEERRRAWDRMLRGVGLQAVHLDLAEGANGEDVTHLERGLWPALTSEPGLR